MKILALHGEKQSGKDSLANYICGHELLREKKVKYFKLNEEGKLVVNCHNRNEQGELEYSEGILDLNYQASNNYQLIEFLAINLWPKVKVYHFADNLKLAVHNIFNIPRHLLWGNDAAKNSPTHIKWKDMFSFLPPKTIYKMKKDGFEDKLMTVREVLQYFGTDICRKLDDNCWINSTIQDITNESPELAIIADSRFLNECDALKRLGATIVRTVDTSKEKTDTHQSESEHVPESMFSLTVDKKDFADVNDRCKNVMNYLYAWGTLEQC